MVHERCIKSVGYTGCPAKQVPLLFLDLIFCLFLFFLHFFSILNKFSFHLFFFQCLIFFIFFLFLVSSSFLLFFKFFDCCYFLFLSSANEVSTGSTCQFLSVCLFVCLCFFPVFFSRPQIGSYTGF